MKTLYVLVAVLAVASCLADKENRRRPGLRGKARAGARKVARHEDKGERVWHLAQSAEECGTFAHGDLHQRDSRPHELCTEVNQTLLICSTRDTEAQQLAGEAEPEPEPEAGAEPREARHEGEGEHHHLWVPREDAEWDFKTGVCEFKLHIEKEDEEEEEEGSTLKKKRKKVEKKRMDDRSKLRKKLKSKKTKSKKLMSGRQGQRRRAQPRNEE